MRPAAVVPPPPPALRVRSAVLLRLLAIQGAWNYETLMGNGIAFCLEPALRRLPGGVHAPAFKGAIARQSRYFNAHPYLAAFAVGALARAELDGEPADRIERFRTALCGPLGSVGDRLVWAGWLPLSSYLALALFGLGVSPAAVVVSFLVLYNAGHVALLLWGMRTGWNQGLGVASGLGHPVLRRGPAFMARAAALAAGIGIPLAFTRVVGEGRTFLGEILLGTLVGAVIVVKAQARMEGWRFALLVVSAFVLYSVIR
ncbi:MAG TPA: PTS system mannose/fructose/sorbose family transporter subunit IID [Gemmatimonadaceae bacterium]